MSIEWKLTLDGIATLLAGVIAFVAVMLQIWSSSRQLRKQLADQRIRTEADEGRRRLSVARAILFEIDFVFRIISDQVHADDFDRIHLTTPNHFPVYEANAGDLGNLGPDVAQEIVRFYGVATRHSSTSQQCLREIEAAKNAAESASLGDVRRMSAMIVEGNYPTVLMKSFGEIKEAARRVCTLLCALTDVKHSVVYSLSEAGVVKRSSHAQAY